MNIAVNNVSFQAILDINQIQGNQKRWENISKEFEAQTQEYPEDIFILSGSGNFDNHIGFTYSGKEYQSKYQGFIFQNAMRKLGELSDSEIASKLVKIFKAKRQIDILEKDVHDALPETSKAEIENDEFLSKNRHNMYI